MPQSLSRILLHLIFSTKNRVSCFTDSGVRKDLHGYLAATANHLGSPAICVGGVADHVHVVCSLGRTLSVATVVAKLKVSSNLLVRERYLSEFSWQNGYAAFSVSESGYPIRVRAGEASQNGYLPRRISGIFETA
jgi:putative transposase